ncbi:MAG: hypothetical protein ACOCZT_02045 [Halanaerobiales bacterium]
MIFFEYMIELLIEKSDTFVVGFIVILFGSCGWLLWHIKNKIDMYYINWEKRLEKSEEERKILFEMEKKLVSIKKLEEKYNSLNKDLEECKKQIISGMKEETEEIKEIVKILLGQYRQLIDSKKDAKYKNQKGEK